MIREKLEKLIDVKSITTFAIVAGVTYGFIVDKVNPETYCTFAASIIAYYFTRNKNGGE